MKKIFVIFISLIILTLSLDADIVENINSQELYPDNTHSVTYDGIMVSGVIDQDTTWSDTISVVGDVTINDGITLTIEPGSTIKFMGHYKLNVQGRLLAVGTETDSILFTITDTTNFTNMNTTAGGWHGIRFNNTPVTNDTSRIVHCKIQYGKAVSDNSDDRRGGAIYIQNFKKVIIDNCTITNNRCSTWGGGIFMNHLGSGTVVKNSIICYNSAGNGGGIACDIYTNPKIINSIITNNLVSEKGGGIWCHWFSSPIIINCIISNNEDAGIFIKEGDPLIVNSTITNNNYSGIVYHEEYYPFTEDNGRENKLIKNDIKAADNILRGFNIINTILWGNSIHEVLIVGDYYVETNFYYCDIQGGINGIAGYSYVDIYENNIDVDPLFISPSGGAGIGFDGLNADWSLQSSSICINHGNPDTTGLYLPGTDLAGNPRIYNGTLDIIDIGAYEYQGEPDPIPKIVTDPSELSFGFCTVDSTSLVKSFTISNIGHSILEIDSINAPTDFEVKREGDPEFSSMIASFTIAAYHDTLINVVFKPTVAQNYSEDIIIKCNDPNDDTVLVNVSGIGTSAPVVSGVIDNDTMWDADTIKVVGSVTINDSVTLTINPGTVIEFQGKYKINVQGRILAIGTESDTITFIAKDPSNGWNGIRFNETSTTNDSSKFAYCNLKYSRYNGWRGGGLFQIINFSKIMISNCLINNNSSEGNGGAIFCDYSSPIISNCSINNNLSEDSGGAIHLWYSSPTISNCIINNNSSFSHGGAIRCWRSSPIISHCSINNNSCRGAGGAIYCANFSSPIIMNSTIEDNFADDWWDEYWNNPGVGGGISCWGSSPVIYNSKIAGNTTDSGECSSAGGGIYFEGYFYTSNLNIINSSIINNSAVNGASIYCHNSAFVNVINTISWNNSTEEIYFSQIQDSNTISISYSDIQGGEDGIVTNNNGTVYWLEGNIDENPLFENNYHLSSGSPCIDAGTPDTTGLHLPPWDLDGNVRIWDGNGDSLAIVDMGCYEFGAPFYGVDDPPDNQMGFQLYPNYPNPFSNSTNISFNIPGTSKTFQIKIYNIKGQIVKTIDSNNTGQISNEVVWDGKDDQGKALSNGIYLYQLTGKNYTSKIMKMILIR